MILARGDRRNLEVVDGADHDGAVTAANKAGPTSPSIVFASHLQNLFSSELIGRAMTVLSEPGNVPEVQSNGSRTVVSTLEFFQHALSKLGHHNAS
jgi:hypothetical protein